MSVYGPPDDGHGGMPPFSVGDKALEALKEVRRDLAFRDLGATKDQLEAERARLRKELIASNRQLMTTEAALEAALDVNRTVIHEIAALQAGEVTEMRFSDPRRQELRQALYTSREDEHLRRISGGSLALDAERMAETRPLKDLQQPTPGKPVTPPAPAAASSRPSIFGRRGGAR